MQDRLQCEIDERCPTDNLRPALRPSHADRRAIDQCHLVHFVLLAQRLRVLPIIVTFSRGLRAKRKVNKPR